MAIISLAASSKPTEKTMTQFKGLLGNKDPFMYIELDITLFFRAQLPRNLVFLLTWRCCALPNKINRFASTKLHARYSLLLRDNCTNDKKKIIPSAEPYDVLNLS